MLFVSLLLLLSLLSKSVHAVAGNRLRIAEHSMQSCYIISIYKDILNYHRIDLLIVFCTVYPGVHNSQVVFIVIAAMTISNGIICTQRTHLRKQRLECEQAVYVIFECDLELVFPIGISRERIHKLKGKLRLVGNSPVAFALDERCHSLYTYNGNCRNEHQQHLA